MTSDPKLLRQHAHWCRIAAGNAHKPERVRTLQVWADKLEDMAVRRADEASMAADIVCWPAAAQPVAEPPERD